MAINLLQTLKNKVGTSLADNSATFFNEEQANMGKAVDGTFAAILAGMIQRVSYDKGAKDLHKILKSETVRDYDLEDIFTRSPQTVNGLVNRGQHFLPSLYPGKLREATNVVAEESNIRKDSASKMSKLSAPLMLSSIAREVQGKNLSVDGLKSLLNGQKDNVKSALPDSFFEMTELSSFGWVKKEKVVEEPAPKKVKKEKPVKPAKPKKVEPVVAKAPVEEVKTGGLGIFKWLLALLIAAGFIWLLMTKGCFAGADKIAPAVTDKVTKTTTAVTDVADKATKAVGDAFGKVNETAKGLLDEIKFARGSAGAQMMNFIKRGNKGKKEGRFVFKNLNFASGSANIAGKSGLEVDNLSAILKAYEDIKVKIEGYTDSQGNPDSNQVLSQQRAEAVRARLVAAGIPDTRISTEGFGAANPVATNDTPEGRAKNRRIEVVIVK